MIQKRICSVSLPASADTSTYFNEWRERYFQDDGKPINNISYAIVLAVLQMYRPDLGIHIEDRYIMAPSEEAKEE